MIDFEIKANKDSLLTTGVETVKLFATVKNKGTEPPLGDVYIVFFAKQAKSSMYYNPICQIFDGVSVNNEDWEYIDANPYAYVWKYKGNKSEMLGSSKIGFLFTYDSQGTSGFGGLTFSLMYSGIEVTQSNNTYIILHTWNPQPVN